jgi:endonuclease YncB( thermonuclease family)
MIRSASGLRMFRGRGRRLDRRLKLALALLACLIAFYAFRYWNMQTFAPVIGTARVIDGDTIQISTMRIRLEGIDAPEWNQTCRDAKGQSWPCGKTATLELTGLLRGHELTCKPEGFDRYQRLLAVCLLPDGSDVNAWMVRQGWAVISGFTSGYRSEQNEAKAARRGIWAGQFDQPRDWRRRHPN